MAAVLAFAVDAGDLSLHPERRPAVVALQPTDGLVERAVAVVVLAALPAPTGVANASRTSMRIATSIKHHFAVARISIASRTA